MRRRRLALAVAAAALIGAELAARVVFDFPLYGADSEVGYWPLPNQHGAFLLNNDWAFNEHSLGVAERFRPSAKVDVLLVGDSLVYGGNGLRQADKLGPLLESKTGWQVWPAGAGSWGLQNELAFLRRHPDLVEGADVIAFVVNSGDFAQPSVWTSALTHPRERPALYLPYLFERYVLHQETEGKPATGEVPFPVPQRDVLGDWNAFVRVANKPVVAIAYSAQAESGGGCDWIPPEFKQAGAWTCYDGLAQVGKGGFRDPIHPTPLGNKALAKRLEVAISALRAPAP